jgi:predicted DsbA family dithiol-disulfide isomerase
MGELIELKDQLADRSRPRGNSRGTFFYDISCPFSYLTAERIERQLGEVDWVPAPAGALDDGAWWLRFEAIRALAERRASAARLPLVWPERPGSALPKAMRAAIYADEHGAGGRFALAAARLTFCGGLDVENPEILAVAASAAGIPVRGCLAAAQDPSRDAALAATAQGLRRLGVRRLPAIRLGRRWFQGTQPLAEAAALLQARAL